MSIPNLSEIVALAEKQLHLMELVESNEQALKDLKEELRRVEQEDLPSAMIEAGGLKKITLDSGATVEVKPDVIVSIAKDAQPDAWDWLERNGYGALIKTIVAVEFGKGELEKAEKLVDELSKKKYIVQLTRGVHAMTLKAFIMEQIRNQSKDTPKAKRLPLDVFGATPYNKAIVKAAKGE